MYEYKILEQVPYYPADMVEYLEEVMYKNGIGPDAIAHALGKVPRTVEKWLPKGEDGRRHFNDLGKTKIKEIQRGIDMVLRKRGKGTLYSYLEEREIELRRLEVYEALCDSLKKIIRCIDTRDLQTLERVAWDMFQKQHKYPGFYYFGPEASVIDTVETNGETGLQTESLSYRWIDDSSLYMHDGELDKAELAHAEAEALANETIETGPDDPSGGRWDIWEQFVHDERKQTLAEVWAIWADSRPTDMPMTPEFRQLLAILELEAPATEQPADDAQGDAEPMQ